MSTRHVLLPFLALSVILAIGGCPPRHDAKVPEVSPAMVDYAAGAWPASDPLQLQRGRALLVGGRCSECHGMPGPGSESAEEWPGVVQRMGRKAKLSDAEREDLLRFVLAAKTAK